MKWIGLTGCMGCGKSTVADILKQDHGLQVLSADEVALNILKNDQHLHDYILDHLKIEFDPDFSAYRKKISEIIFNDPKILKDYEDYFHPKVKLQVQNIKQAWTKNHRLAFYDVPLLFEKNMENDFDAVIGVFADHDVQMNRLKSRNQWTDQQIADRLKHQIDNASKIKKCDFVLFNNSSLENLKIQVTDVLSKLISH